MGRFREGPDTPPRKFLEAYTRAAELGLHRVAHAGEEGGADFVKEAVQVLGCERCYPTHCFTHLCVYAYSSLTMCTLQN